MSVASFARVIGRRVFRQSFVLIYQESSVVNLLLEVTGRQMDNVPGDSKTYSRATVKRVSRRDRRVPKKHETHLESKGNRRTRLFEHGVIPPHKIVIPLVHRILDSDPTLGTPYEIEEDGRLKGGIVDVLSLGLGVGRRVRSVWHELRRPRPSGGAGRHCRCRCSPGQVGNRRRGLDPVVRNPGFTEPV